MIPYRRRVGKSAATFFAVLVMFLFVVALFAGVFFWQGERSVRVDGEREYYFLVRECEDTTASAVSGQVYLSGGAGYLLETNGRSCVVLAGYFRLEDAERVKSTMAEKEIFADVLVLRSEDFFLEGDAAEEKNRVEGNLKTAETCARVLYDAANGLERTSLTQEEAKSAVRGVSKSLKGLREGNASELFSRWNAELVAAERRCTEICEGILFAKDLRYLQVQLLMAVVNADGYFAR